MKKICLLFSKNYGVLIVAMFFYSFKVFAGDSIYSSICAKNKSYLDRVCSAQNINSNMVQMTIALCLKPTQSSSYIVVKTTNIKGQIKFSGRSGTLTSDANKNLNFISQGIHSQSYKILFTNDYDEAYVNFESTKHFNGSDISFAESYTLYCQ